MMRRQGQQSFPADGETTEVSGSGLMTVENVTKLAEFATHWAVIMHFENDELVPNHNLFPTVGLINLFEQNKLSRVTMLAGFKASRQPKRPVPACFFRTLDFLLQYVAAGNVYRPISDKENEKGAPPAGWLRVPLVASPEDAPAAAAAAGAPGTPDADQHTHIATGDPMRLFYAARSWCFLQSFHVAGSSTRLNIGVPADQMYELFFEQKLSEYSLMVGLTEPRVAGNIYVPPSLMLPLGALLHMQRCARFYLPASLSDLRDTKYRGYVALGARKDARPCRLPETLAFAPRPPEPHAPPPKEEPTVTIIPGAEGVIGLPGSAASRQASRQGSSAAAGPSSGAGGSGGGGGVASSGSAARPAAVAAAPAGATDANGTAPSHTTAPSSAPPALSPPEPDPLLNSANFIMPAPFDSPSPTPADAAAAADAAAPVDALAALPSSPFLGQFNHGVQPTYETPPLKLFFGHRGQISLSTNWWFIEHGTSTTQGPYSPEQMLLSYVAGCRELHEETLVCGTEADIKPPMKPPPAAFLQLGDLLARGAEEGAAYAPVTRADILSPLASRLLGNRIRITKPPPAAAGPAAQVPTAAAPVAPVAAAAAAVAAAPAAQPPSAAPPPAQGAPQPPAPPPPPPAQQQQPQPPPPPPPQQQQHQSVFMRPMAPQPHPHQLPPHMGGPRPRPPGVQPMPPPVQGPPQYFVQPGQMVYMPYGAGGMPYGAVQAMPQGMMMQGPMVGPHMQVMGMQHPGHPMQTGGYPRE